MSSGNFVMLKIISVLIGLWTRTLRFRFCKDSRAVIENAPKPLVAVLWHNRLSAFPEFYRRYVRDRKLATIVSASNAGAWLSGLFELMGIKPIRGSRNRRGVQSFREMLKASKSGYDIGITPDGSRGPMYEMKPGAVSLALRTGVPVALVSFNFKQSFRLATWDRFYIPYPFSCVEVHVDVIEKSREFFSEDMEQAAQQLKVRMDALTKDSAEDLYGKVI